MDRWIFHVDVNAFYASVEINDHPEYQGKPVVVCSNRQRAIITTANYIARKYNIESAMPLSVALKKCPDLIITGLNFSRYQEVSRQFVALVSNYSDKIQQASIDECYLDVTKPITTYQKPLDMAVHLQKDIQKTLKLDVSIGIASNMFLAKMASNLKKPNGISIIRDDEIATKLWPLPIEDMHGIGKKTVAILKAMNINTIRDLANTSYEQLITVFKNHTQEVIDRAWGLDFREVEPDQEIKSIGQSSSLIKVTDDADEIQTTLKACCYELSRRLKRRQSMLKQLTLSIKDEDHQSHTRSMILDKPIVKADDIYEQALVMLEDHFMDWPIRNIGISTSKIVSEQDQLQQLSLFKE